MRRTLEAELLDSLAPDHPDALHNRRDLRLTNVIMGNHRWIEAELRRAADAGLVSCTNHSAAEADQAGARHQPYMNILEIGAGTGELGGRLAAAGFEVDGLDLWPRPPGWAGRSKWHQANLLEFERYAEYRAIVGNLIFHQFSEDDLARLGSRIRQAADLVIACEPVRRRASQAIFAAGSALLGGNYVTRHDARVSIAAGFVGDELPRALGLVGSDWECRCTTTLLGAYRLVARRKA